MTTTHNFKDSFARSNQRVSEGATLPYLQSLFPGAIIVTALPNTPEQLSGIDYWAIYPDGTRTAIEEKVRDRDYSNDLALEYVSNDMVKTPGWMEKDLACDYLVVVWQDGHVSSFKWEWLRFAWEQNREQWLKKYRTIKADNGTHNALCLIVPIGVVNEAMNHVCEWAQLYQDTVTCDNISRGLTL